MATEKERGSGGVAAAPIVEIDSIMRMHEFNGSAPWSLWQGKEIVTNSDKGDGNPTEVLQQFLAILHATGTSAPHVIKFHTDSEEAITDRTPVVGSTRFRLHDYNYVPGARVGAAPGGANVNSSLMGAIREKIEFENLMSEWAENNGYVKADEIDDDYDPDDVLGKALHSVGKAGDKHPWMQEHISDGITMLKHWFGQKTGIKLNDMNHSVGAAPNVANDQEHAQVPKLTQQQLESVIPALAVLFHEHPEIAGDVHRLAVLAQNDKDVFNLAIKKLRQMFE